MTKPKTTLLGGSCSQMKSVQREPATNTLDVRYRLVAASVLAPSGGTSGKGSETSGRFVAAGWLQD